MDTKQNLKRACALHRALRAQLIKSKTKPDLAAVQQLSLLADLQLQICLRLQQIQEQEELEAEREWEYRFGVEPHDAFLVHQELLDCDRDRVSQ